jgi:integrase/recombinase XerC
MDYIQAFINYISIEKRYSNLTAQAYLRDLEQFFSFLKAEYQFDDISLVKHTQIRSWLATLMQQQNNTAKSINRKISTLKSFYKYLLRQEHIKELPTLKIVSPKNIKRLPVFASESQMEQLMEVHDFGEGFNNQTQRLIVEILYATGMRRSELINLSIKNIDLSNSLIKILGKGNKERLMPIPQELAQLIKSYLTERIHFDSSGMNQLLINEKGKPLYDKYVYLVVKKHLGAVTTHDKKGPHTLRHSFATHLLNNGAQLNAVKELLGHANLAATQVYTHNSIDQLKNVFRKAHPKA